MQLIALQCKFSAAQNGFESLSGIFVDEIVSHIPFTKVYPLHSASEENILYTPGPQSLYFTLPAV